MRQHRLAGRFVMRFVQVTDTHVVPRGESVLGLDPVARLEACIADINRNRSDASFCIFTGDLTDRGETEGYRELRECLASLELPYHLMVGNHDRRDQIEPAHPEYAEEAEYRMDGIRGGMGLFKCIWCCHTVHNLMLIVPESQP